MCSSFVKPFKDKVSSGCYQLYVGATSRIIIGLASLLVGKRTNRMSSSRVSSEFTGGKLAKQPVTFMYVITSIK